MKLKIFSLHIFLQTLLSFAYYFATKYLDFQRYDILLKSFYGILSLTIIYFAIKKISEISKYSLINYTLFGSLILLFSDFIFQPIKIFLIENYKTIDAKNELYLSISTMAIIGFCFSIPISFYFKNKSISKSILLFLALSMLFNLLRKKYSL